MQKHRRFLISFLFFISFFFVIPTALAAPKVGDAGSMLDQTVGQTGVEKTDVTTMAGTVIKVAMSLVGFIFFALMIYGGFKWMTARGNDEQATKAKNAVIAASIGLVIIVSAYALTTLITRSTVEGYQGGGASTDDSAGGNPMGCCLEKVETAGGTFGGGQSAWVSSITTQALCEIAGNDDMGGDDLAYGAGTWEWYEGLSAAACESNADAEND